MSNSEVVRAVQSLSEKQFDAFFKSTYTRVFHYLHKLCGQQQQAEDIAQDIYLLLWEKKHLLPADEQERTYYLFTVARNAFLKHTQQLTREQKLIATLSQSDSSPVIQLPEQKLELLEQEKIVHDTLATAQDKAREYFILSREQGMSAKQIAENEGVSQRTVERYIFAIVKNLRARLTSFFSLF